MGLFDCCFAPPAAAVGGQASAQQKGAAYLVPQDAASPTTTPAAEKTAAPTIAKAPTAPPAAKTASPAASSPPVAASKAPPTSQAAVSSSLKSLSATEQSAVQGTLLKVSTLIQKFAEGRTERTTPVQAVKRALNLVIADCKATYASVYTISENQDTALLLCFLGLPDTVHEHSRVLTLSNSNTAVETVVKSGQDFLSWTKQSEAQPPSEWEPLSSQAGLAHLSCVPVKVSDKVIGVLTMGFQDNAEEHPDYMMWPTYLQLVSASLASMVKDNTIAKYMALVKEMRETEDLDLLIHNMVTHMRSILGHGNSHLWYRVALTAANNTAATIFDDLTQVPAPLMQRTGQQNSNAGGSSSFRLLKEVQAAGGIMRTVVAMKSTVMKIAVHNRQQVMIPDVQKLINQSGNVSVDIFNTRLIKPPTSVLVFPLKVKQHIFGVMFCMSSVQTDFADVSPKLRETCDITSPHLLALLATSLANDYRNMQQNSANAIGPNGTINSSNVVTEGSISKEMLQLHRSNSESLGVSMSGDSFMYAQSRSSTGALVTGLTEKLNQKRIRSAMDFQGSNVLADLQVTALLGEGGFAKVFRGLWRGLVVGAKVVADDGKNEKMVVKNAHEIAILSALSHPNIVQAYICLTDVLVRDLINLSMRGVSPTVLNSPAYKYMVSMEDKPCHIEVIEYCDLGNLSMALKNSVFMCNNNDGLKPGDRLAALQGPNPETASQMASQMAALKGGKVNMRTLLLTLIEIASAMCYLHKMGVVHCDLKPANVLLKSSNIDNRGFTVKVSDFGLSRVEDDESCSSFPFNSCGTAAYVAPEALICNKKVNSSVDVYAYGILMYEMYTAQRPYGNMKQQQLVEEVVMRGLRPKFPSHAPANYVLLAQSCWSGSPQARPTFEESLTTLNSMLQAMDDREMGSVASMSYGSMSEQVEYLQPGQDHSSPRSSAPRNPSFRKEKSRSNLGMGQLSTPRT